MYPFIAKYFCELTLEEYHRIVQAREAVFFLEQHITEGDADEIDTKSVFMWAEDAGRVIAFLRIIPAGVLYEEEVSIGRVLVDAAYRRKGLCRRLMLEAMRYVETRWGQQPIRISAQEYLSEFYCSLGFEPVSDLYFEAGIPHVKMLYKDSDK